MTARSLLVALAAISLVTAGAVRADHDTVRRATTEPRSPHPQLGKVHDDQHR